MPVPLATIFAVMRPGKRSSSGAVWMSATFASRFQCRGSSSDSAPAPASRPFNAVTSKASSVTADVESVPLAVPVASGTPRAATCASMANAYGNEPRSVPVPCELDTMGSPRNGHCNCDHCARPSMLDSTPFNSTLPATRSFTGDFASARSARSTTIVLSAKRPRASIDIASASSCGTMRSPRARIPSGSISTSSDTARNEKGGCSSHGASESSGEVTRPAKRQPSSGRVSSSCVEAVVGCRTEARMASASTLPSRLPSIT